MEDAKTKVVPVEPTEEMGKAAWATMSDEFYEVGIHLNMMAAIRAAIAAAPTPAEQVALEKAHGGFPVHPDVGIESIAAERRRQIEVEGWTAEHDDRHVRGELAGAAGVYALVASGNAPPGVARLFWPWDFQWWKPSDRRQNLVKAGALIAAEIERLDRAEASK